VHTLSLPWIGSWRTSRLGSMMPTLTATTHALQPMCRGAAPTGHIVVVRRPAAHTRSLMAAKAARPSRSEVMQVRAPMPGVAIAHVRRQAVTETADGFSEIALSVLIERGGKWWLAAAQNTAIAAQLPR
jgi:hypothetical protein